MKYLKEARIEEEKSRFKVLIKINLFLKLN